MKIEEGKGDLYLFPWPMLEDEEHKQAIQNVIAAVADDPSTPEEYARLALGASDVGWYDCQTKIIKAEPELAVNPRAADSICAGSGMFDIKIKYVAFNLSGIVIGKAYLTDLRNYKAGKATADEIRCHMIIRRYKEIFPEDTEEE